MNTYVDLYNQVTRHLQTVDRGGDFDPVRITEDIRAAYGVVDIDTIDRQELAAILQRHDATRRPTARPFEDARMRMLEAAGTTIEEWDPQQHGEATIRGLAILFTLAGGDIGYRPRLYARDVASYINDAILEYGSIVAPDDLDERGRVYDQIWQTLADRAAEQLPAIKRSVDGAQ